MKNLFLELSSKQLRNVCGIYLLKIDTHLYVGSSKSLYSRLCEHRRDLKNNNHNNSQLLRCYNKYNDVYFDILELCDHDVRIEREKMWISKLKADLNQQDPVTKELSHASKLKISASLKDAYRTGRKSKPMGQPIESYDFTGTFIKEYKDVYEASAELKYNVHTIQIAASKYYAGRTCGLHRFRYKNSKVSPKKFIFTNTNKVTSKFDFIITEPDGTICNIKAGIKNINEAILQQLFKGNYTFTISGIPKSPLNRVNCLETPAEGNQQPS